jgi:hypothetical protein
VVWAPCLNCGEETLDREGANDEKLLCARCVERADTRLSDLRLAAREANLEIIETDDGRYLISCFGCVTEKVANLDEVAAVIGNEASYL